MKTTVTIARITVKELIRSRALYGIFGFVFLALLCATFFGTVSIGSQTKVIKDFALFLVSISSAGLAIFAGTSLLNKELTRKTIYNILSKPVERSEFIIGKFVGMLGACTTVIVVLLPLCILYLFLFEGQFDFSLCVAGLYMMMEAAILCAAALFFSALISTPSLSGILAFGLFLAGRSVESLLYFIKAPDTTPLLKAVLTGLYWSLPQLNRLTVANDLVYGYIPSFSHMMMSALYSISYAGILLILGIVIFNRKELH